MNKKLNWITAAILLLSTLNAPLYAAEELKVVRVGVVNSGSMDYSAWPSVAISSGGRVMVVYSGGRAGHISRSGKIMFSISDDMGVAWSEPRVLFDGALDDRDPAITFLDRNQYFVTWKASKLFAHPKFVKNKEVLTASIDYLSSVDRSVLGNSSGNWAGIFSDEGKLLGDSIFTMPVDTPNKAQYSSETKLISLAGISPKGDLVTTKYGLETRSWETGRTALRKSQALDRNIVFHEPFLLEVRNQSRIFLRARKESDFPNPYYTAYDAQHEKWRFPVPIEDVYGFPVDVVESECGGYILTSANRYAPKEVAVYFENYGSDVWVKLGSLAQLQTVDSGYARTARAPDGQFMTVFYDGPKGQPKKIKFVVWTIEEVC